MGSVVCFSDFVARLREFIRTPAPGIGPAPGDNGVTQSRAGDRAPCLTEFGVLALELFALQFEHNRPYRLFCSKREIQPGAIKSWKQIPAVPTAAFKELELTCLAPEARSAVFFSSGTSRRRPSRHFHNQHSLEAYEASLWPWFKAHCLDCERETRLVILTPSRRQAPNSSLVHMFETVRLKLGEGEGAFFGALSDDGGWLVDFDAAIAAFETASSDGRPVLILGTAFLFLSLLDRLAETQRRFRLPPGSRAMETGGYKGQTRELPKTLLHSLITTWLGIPATNVISEYGMSELSSQAYSAPLDRREQLWFPPWARVQIVSPETGEEVDEGGVGLIRILDLANVFSVLAVQTEDLGVRRGGGFELIGRAAMAEPRGCSLMSEIDELA